MNIASEPTDTEAILCHAEALIAHAHRLGLVLTIDLVPNKPLAMGNYTPVVNVRPINVREVS